MSEDNSLKNNSVKAAPIAKPFREETRNSIAEHGVSPRIVGFLANSDPAAYQYAHFTKKTLEQDGITFDLIETTDVEVENEVITGTLSFFPNQEA